MLHGNAFVATESLFLEGTAKRAENSNAERQMAYTFSGHPGARKQLDYECILCEFSFCVNFHSVWVDNSRHYPIVA